MKKDPSCQKLFAREKSVNGKNILLKAIVDPLQKNGETCKRLSDIPLTFLSESDKLSPCLFVSLHFFATLEREAAVVGIVCLVFLILFIIAGFRQIKKNGE